MAYTDLVNRDHEIAEYIEKCGNISLDSIISRFGISPSTARRILRRMAKTGVVGRTHGGAYWLGGNVVEAPAVNRSKMHVKEKNLIAAAAASLVSTGETIILLAGTTVNAFADKLKEKKGIKVITNSLPVLTQLQQYEDIEIIFLGGLLNRKEQSVGGYLTGLCSKDLLADKIFFGVKGITPDGRLTLDDVNERDNFKLFISSARESVVLADSSKFSQSGTIALCSLADTSTLVTDVSAPDKVIRRISEQGVRVIVASEAQK